MSLTRLPIVAAEYCRQLKAECKRQEDEAIALRGELRALGTHIQ